MKENNRLRLAASLGNTPDGVIFLRLEDFDGGEFNLPALTDEEGVLLPDPQSPRYAVKVTGSNPAALKRFANALNALARKQESGDGDSDGDDAGSEDDN